MLFDEAQTYLLSLGNEVAAMKLGLETSRRLLATLDFPQLAYRRVQIAGTNGKGSTAAMLASITVAAQIRTGLYTSPHLVRLTERITINNREISETEFAACASSVRTAAEKVKETSGALPTFFEQVTAIALLAFQRAGVELAILETGLGGRLDATTAAEASVVGITSIGLDHQQYLGATLELIAREKAAIIKPDTRAAIIAPQVGEVEHAIKKYLADTKTTARFLVSEDATITSFDERGALRFAMQTSKRVWQDLRLSLCGAHQLTNAQLAVELAEHLAPDVNISDDALRRGLASTVHHGRLEWLTLDNQNYLLDGAHNAAGAKALAIYLREFAPAPLTLVCGAMRDKDLRSLTEHLFPLAHHIILTRPMNERAAPIAEFETLARRYESHATVKTCAEVSEALQAAFELNARRGTICVCGSLYLVGEARRILV